MTTGDMQLQYKHVLVLGATSGIGWALAAKLVETGTSVTVVGRRKEKLDDFLKQYGSIGSVSVDSAVFDITDLKGIPQFASDMFKKHPSMDCVFLNSGMQRAVNWTEPEKIDLEAIDLEVLTNFTSFMHLTKAFLPYLQKQSPKETALIFTTSGLALIPSTQCPVYCGTKAGLHQVILAMREQLRGTSVKVIELFPPAVQTELHDFESGEKGKYIGMPLEDFTEEAFEGLCGDENEQIPVQAVKTSMGFNTWERERQKIMMKFIEMIRQRN